MVCRSQTSATAARPMLDRDLGDQAREIRRESGPDEQAAGQDDGDRRSADDPQGRPIADRRPIAQRERADRRADRSGRDDRQRDRDRGDPADPWQRLADRGEAAGEQVERPGDDLRADEGDSRGNPEGRAIEDVVVAPVAQEEQRAGHHRGHAEERDDHAEGQHLERDVVRQLGVPPLIASTARPKATPHAAPQTSVRARTRVGVSS